ncbi:Dabb family protein [Microbacterium deminutum]|uniref:Dabb family protein n=1 Tax=Microbacterium deminutum TaxID=344164 RepID=A0ABP5BUK1_9MICO
MIQHTVVFSLTYDEGSAEEAEFLSTGRSVLSAIPGVENFVVNRQVSPKSGFRHQFSMDFVDEDAYTAYNGHPDHVRFVAERWDQDVAAFQEFDFVAV